MKDVNEKMKELSKVISYEFEDISLLKKAMGAIKITGKNEYKNQSLATVGDALLKALICDHFYSKDNNIYKQAIDDEKKKLENNDIFRKIMDEEDLRKYTYNDKHFYGDNDVPDHEKVFKSHDPYIEAIVAAIYYDGDWIKLKNWFERWLLPLLNKYKTLM